MSIDNSPSLLYALFRLVANFDRPFDEKLGVLKEELSVWDRNAGSYNKKDILHLGRSGIRLLANVFRDSILSKLTTSRGYSDALTNHTRGHLSQHSR